MLDNLITLLYKEKKGIQSINILEENMGQCIKQRRVKLIFG